MKTQEYCYTANEVFDERNKAYGAYPLRKEYANRINKALLGSVLSFVTIITVPTVYRNYFYTPPTHDYISEQVLELTPLEIAQPKNKVVLPPPPPERSTPPPPKAPMQRFVPPVVVHETDATETPHTQEDLSKKAIGSENVAGENDIDPNEPLPEDFGDGKGKEGIIETVAEPDPVLIVEQMPRFGNGNSDLLRFFAEHIRYPNAAAKNNVEGTVFVTFVVGANGSVRDISVVKGIGFGCDEEALRVANLMPAWTPGKQGGRAVPVKFTIPIRFSLRQ